MALAVRLNPGYDNMCFGRGVGAFANKGQSRGWHYVLPRGNSLTSAANVWRGGATGTRLAIGAPPCCPLVTGANYRLDGGLNSLQTAMYQKSCFLYRVAVGRRRCKPAVPTRSTTGAFDKTSNVPACVGRATARCGAARAVASVGLARKASISISRFTIPPVSSAISALHNSLSLRMSLRCRITTSLCSVAPKLLTGLFTRRAGPSASTFTRHCTMSDRIAAFVLAVLAACWNVASLAGALQDRKLTPGTVNATISEEQYRAQCVHGNHPEITALARR